MFLSAVLRYAVAVFTTELISGSDKFDAFITIHGEQGDTGQRRLHESLTYPRPFAAGQVDLFFIEAVQLGQLQHALLEFSSYGKGQMMLNSVPRTSRLAVQVTCKHMHCFRVLDFMIKYVSL